ncbi:related to CAP1 - F-actin capping protein alpha subunit [Melanopsichium pennsylvanicum]|uniref:Related to CAP1 - F-actin capping protein alpha subunit n=2 Tax=Melanopsichium pennsylvanicum TaxID=63383 RepID=A0AAJ4XHC5_9BASI|nr:related to CAP1-F-actin capping protein alpha subunit [Melanopsichium pennsylvanicum 4]SNX81746.1 related to CAP1 - F-actin capping protein alpha subunit [Melanopsichium pennsylvanicum]
MSNNARLHEALQLLTQSPPGQTTQVYHDLRGILLNPSSDSPSINDATLQSAAAVALEEYNTRQLVTATVDDVATIICQAAEVADGTVEKGTTRYVAPKVGKTFVYDHVKRSVSDVKPVVGSHESVERMRKNLEKALDEYVKDRYADGVSSVFAISSVALVDKVKHMTDEAMVEDAKTPSEPAASVVADADPQEQGTIKNESTEADQTKVETATEEEANKDDDLKDDPIEAAETAEAAASSESALTEPKIPSEPPKTTFIIHHVGNRFNLSNFWSGRWRASYTLDPLSRTLTSSLSVQVHYFENGNVQLNASKPRTFTLPSTEEGETLIKEVVKVISNHEDGWQKGLEQSYDQLAEGAFKALRRQLPLTRQKLDWDKVLNYKLGDELSRA